MWDLTGREVYETAQGYWLVYLPEHPNARNGTVLLHRVLMENALGRPLRPGEVVHHKDKNKSNNAPENLELMSRSSHAQHHAQERPVRGEVKVMLTCPTCKKQFERLKRQVKTEKSYCSHSCSAKTNSIREIPHGKYGRYRKGCRCVRCREANTIRCRK